MTALSEAPDLYQLPEDPEARKNWRIDHEGQCVWVMRKLRDKQRRRRQMEKIAEAEMDLVRRWLAQECAEVDRDSAQLEGYLKDYVMRVRAASAGEEKHVNTPYGRVSTKVAPAKWEQDSEKVLAWARKRAPNLIRNVESFNLAEAKKVIPVVDGEPFDPETGERIEGLTVTPGGISASITLDMSGGGS